MPSANSEVPKFATKVEFPTEEDLDFMGSDGDEPDSDWELLTETLPVIDHRPHYIHAETIAQNDFELSMLHCIENQYHEHRAVLINQVLKSVGMLWGFRVDVYSTRCAMRRRMFAPGIESPEQRRAQRNLDHEHRAHRLNERAAASQARRQAQAPQRQAQQQAPQR